MTILKPPQLSMYENCIEPNGCMRFQQLKADPEYPVLSMFSQGHFSTGDTIHS